MGLSGAGKSWSIFHHSQLTVKKKRCHWPCILWKSCESHLSGRIRQCEVHSVLKFGGDSYDWL